MCRALAQCSEEPGFTTRTCLSNPMRDVHLRLGAWMTRAGMSVHVDAIGNLHGAYPAVGADAPRLFIGSHLDTVPRAGAFDGVLGVVLAIALIDLLDGERFPFAIEVIAFSDEEGIRFGVPFLGSRALSGTLDESLLAVRDARGISLREAIRDFGLDPSRVGDVAVRNALAYLELHIEQGPVLEALKRPIAVVDVIVGQTRADVAFAGSAAHAGATPMNSRRDALAGAAEWIGLVERDASTTAGLVATVGCLSLEPGASNVIAGRCSATLDVRHVDDGTRGAAVARLARSGEVVAARRGLDLGWSVRLDQRSVSMDSALTGVLSEAAAVDGRPVPRISSGAGHDAMILAHVMPVAMLLLRNPAGLSHHPDEAVDEDDVAMALLAGQRFLDEFARSRRWSI